MAIFVNAIYFVLRKQKRSLMKTSTALMTATTQKPHHEKNPWLGNKLARIREEYQPWRKKGGH